MKRRYGFPALMALVLASQSGAALAGDGEKYRKELSPEQRRHLREQRERFESMTPEQRKRIKSARRQYHKLSPEQQRELRKKWRRQRNSDNHNDKNRHKKRVNKRGKSAR